MPKKGIDVSHWNGNIDWKAVSKAGIQFAMIRVGTGSRTGAVKLDTKFKENINEAYNNGIKCGCYMYSYADSADSAGLEAESVIKLITPYKSMISFPVAYDLEEDSRTILGKAILTSMAKTFCNNIRTAGFKPMVYANKNWLTNYLDASEINADVWIAQWGKSMTWSGKPVMWQYSDSGSVPGISGNVDLDYSESLYEVNSPTPSSEYDWQNAIAYLSGTGRMNSPDLWREICEGKRTANINQVAPMLTKWADSAANADKYEAAYNKLYDGVSNAIAENQKRIEQFRASMK